MIIISISIIIPRGDVGGDGGRGGGGGGGGGWGGRGFFLFLGALGDTNLIS